MPPSFYFASRGVVRRPRRRFTGGTTSQTMPGVDVQFLRGPGPRAELFETVWALAQHRASAKMKPATTERTTGADYDSRSLKARSAALGSGPARFAATGVYQGRFITDDKPNRRHVTLPVEA